MGERTTFWCVLLLAGICAGTAFVASKEIAASPPSAHAPATVISDQAAAVVVPRVDYHRHLQSPAAARLGAEAPIPTVDVPKDLARLLGERTQRWNDGEALAGLYTEQALLLDPTGPRWVSGRHEVAKRVARYFRRAPYRVTPVAWGVDGDNGYIAGYLTRGETGHFTHVLLTLERSGDGAWRIAAESLFLAGPITPEPVTAEQLVASFDEAGMGRAVVLSLAYWFGSPNRPSVENEYESVRAENDWTAEQAARFPDRLVAFCSFSPLKAYAIRELERCATHPHLKGVKLHFANSGVDVRNPAHVEKVREVFRSANHHRLPLVVHLWVPGGAYGRRDSEIFLERILPAAPDVVVQIAHLAGGGGGLVDEALDPFITAIRAGERRVRNLFFDVTSAHEGTQSQADLRRLAERIRQIGLERILFGSDMTPPPAAASWFGFRARVPLTEREFRTIAQNVAPYLR